MAEQNSIKSLLEKDHIRKKLSCFIQEEVVVPEWSATDPLESSSTTESIVEVLPNAKEISLEEEHISIHKKTNLISNVCGFNVDIKKLLQNEDIRKQVAPFIQKQIIIPVWTESSDVEETDTSNDIIVLSDKNPTREKTGVENLETNEQQFYIKEEIDLDSTDPILVGSLPAINTKEVESKDEDDLSIVKTESETSNCESNSLVVEKPIENNDLVHKSTVTTKNKGKTRGKLNIVKRASRKNHRKLNLLGKIVRRNAKKVLDAKRNSCTETNLTNNGKEVDFSKANKNVNDTGVDVISDVQSSDTLETVSIVKEEPVLPDNMTTDSVDVFEDVCDNKIPLNDVPNVNGISCNVKDLIKPLELENLVKNEIIDVPDETSFELNNDTTGQNHGNLLSKDKISGTVNSGHQYKQKINVNTNYYRRNLGRKRMVKRRKFSKCVKCGKKYKRLEMLKKHEIKCKKEEEEESKDYECAMCIFKTKDQNVFRNHLENHILGKPCNEIRGDISQTDFMKNKMTEDLSCLEYIPKYRCSNCGWYKKNNYDKDGDEEEDCESDDEEDSKVCKKCSANMFIQSSISTFPENKDDECNNSANPKLVCDDKIPYVRLVRLPRSEISAASQPSSTERNVTSQNIFKNNPDTSISSGYDYSAVDVKTEDITIEYEKPSFVPNNDKSSSGNGDNRRKDVIETDDSNNKRKRSLKTSEWIKKFCQKCNEIQSNADNSQVALERSNCEKCKTKLSYVCLKCEGKFSSYYTISYHLRYCCVQSKTKKKIVRRRKKTILDKADLQKQFQDKKYKCSICDKGFNVLANLNIHIPICEKLKAGQSLNPHYVQPSLSKNFEKCVPRKSPLFLSKQRQIPVLKMDNSIMSDT